MLKLEVKELFYDMPILSKMPLKFFGVAFKAPG